MESKKKVKPEEVSDDSNFEMEEKSNNKSSMIKDAYLKDLEEFDAERSLPKTKLKYFGIFLLGVLVTIALFSYLGRNNSNNTLDGKMSDKNVNSVVSNIYDATVYIENYNGNTVSTTGTGFIYKEDRTKGYILTNYHVVAGNTRLMVTLSDDTKVNASFVGGDQYTDIAIISISDDYVKKVASIGSSSKISSGDIVFTVSSPLNNMYRGSVTKGVLSGKDRLVDVGVSSNVSVLKLLQANLESNPGNSGSPLCDSSGRVIGMITNKVVNDNINGHSFAISIEDIKSRLNNYEKGTSNAKPYIGISMVNLSDSSSMVYYGLSSIVDTSLKNGVVVEEVKNDSAAVGVLKIGDIILALNGVDIYDITSLRYELYRHNVGDKIKLKIERNGNIRTVSIILRVKKGY